MGGRPGSAARGGRQPIPRPPRVRPGGPPPWHGRREDAPPVTIDDVRAACADLPPPAAPAVRVAGSVPAAVLLPFHGGDDGGARLLLTKRPETMPSHQGEIAFPGGRVEPTDAGRLATALREAEEEIGLRAADVEVLGELDALDTYSSRFTIAPFVGVIADLGELQAHPREVVAILDVTVGELLDEATYREERWTFGDREHVMHFYELSGETVWGATARILTDFLAHLLAPRPLS